MNPFLHRAVLLALENVKQNGGGPFGAVIVKDKKIIAEGTNLVTSASDPTAHAEIVAIRQACQKLGHFKLDGCVIYTSCEPCPMCLSAIYWSRIEKIFYAGNSQDAAQAGFDDEWIYRELALPSDKRKLPMEKIQLAEAGQPFEEWKRSVKKIPY